MAKEKCGGGYLGRNKYHKDGEKTPEYQGKLKVTLSGVETELELGAWIREKDGHKYFSLSASVERLAAAAPAVTSEDDGEIPF